MTRRTSTSNGFRFWILGFGFGIWDLGFILDLGQTGEPRVGPRDCQATALLPRIRAVDRRRKSDVRCGVELPPASRRPRRVRVVLITSTSLFLFAKCYRYVIPGIR